MGIPSPAVLALSGRPDADFHGIVNFAYTEFLEVRLKEILGSWLRIHREFIGSW